MDFDNLYISNTLNSKSVSVTNPRFKVTIFSNVMSALFPKPFRVSLGKQLLC